MSDVARDPKTDPKPGDVLIMDHVMSHVKRGRVTVTVARPSIHHIRYRVKGDGHFIYAVLPSEWRANAVNAEVIHAAVQSPGPQPQAQSGSQGGTK